MVSIIISSADNTLLNNVTQNIDRTIGVPYEIISFDNSKGTSGLCKLYNEGAQKAKYDILCFMHEDVEIKTVDWGKTIISYFKEDPKLGLVGLAGSSYKSAIPLGWDSFQPNTNYINIIQAYKYSQKEPFYFHFNPNNKHLVEVASIDGVWFCAPKQVVEEIPFDEKGLAGFHGYDIDFSIAVGQRYKVAVTFEVLLVHFSEGHYSPEWLRAIYYVHRKWRKVLPINLDGLKGKDQLKVEVNTFKYVLKAHNNLLSLAEAIDILNASAIPSLSVVRYIRLLYRTFSTYYKSRKVKPAIT